MKINIIRGQNQIGGSIIEISTTKTRIILDAGINLGESKTHSYVPPVAGLFSEAVYDAYADTNGARDMNVLKKYDAVFVSHYHSDHMGLLRFIIPKIPIYMGETAFKIAKSLAESKGNEIAFSVDCFIKEYVPVAVGDITVTPIPCDHSAYGAFMFLIQADGKRLLYTADYRSTGRKSFDELIESLPEIDALLTEGTTLSRGENFHEPKEQELEDFAVKILISLKGPSFVYLSAQNVDRIKTAYNIASRTGRRFIMDPSTDSVSKAAGLELKGEVLSSVSVGSIPNPYFLLCVTPQTLPKIERINRYISFENGTLFFARREVYMLKPVTSALIAFLKARGVDVHLLHTSGHADSKTIERLIRKVKPSTLIPIHTENAEWFSRFEDECEVIYECKDFEI